MPSAAPLPESFGRYRVVEELGSGAMGIVYLCVDPMLARPVAIKVLKGAEHLPPDERTQYEARFRQEAEAAGRLSHPDIVQIYDIGPSWLVMEFVEGRTLQALLHSDASVAVREVVRIVQRVADALDHAHHHGIVHRDIKPANVMLQQDGGVKVMDFGVARLDSSTLTAVGTVLGSVRYMAPEQMMGQRVDGRADVFSLAAVAYELLTGRSPYPGRTVTEVVARVVHGRHVPPREVDGRFPPQLDAVFAGAFMAQPSERFTRALDLARSLADVLRPVGALEVRLGGTAGGGSTTTDGRAPTRKLESTHVLAGETSLAAPTAAQAAPVEAGDASASTRLMEPAPARPARAPAGDTGASTRVMEVAGPQLTVESEPSGAQVELDGRPVGRTPLLGLPVGTGRHHLRVASPGRRTAELDVELTAEQPILVLTLELHERDEETVAPGPGVTPPVRLSGDLPRLPAEWRRAGLSGRVEAEALVDAQGCVTELRLLSSAGPTLDEAFVVCVRAWRFTPARRAGRHVATWLRLRHEF